MNWVEGHNLRENLQKRAEGVGMLAEEVRQIGVQLSHVLDYIHQNGFMHGDIKPENVMLSEGGKITLLDFFPFRKNESIALQRVPKTVRYMAPELIQGGQEPDEQTDLFAFGVLLYELLTHRFPYDIAQLRSYGTGMLHCKPDPLPEEIPEGLQQVLFRTLACDRHERYQHFSQVINALEFDYLIPENLFQNTAQVIRDNEQIPRFLWILAITGTCLMGIYWLHSLSNLLTPSLPLIEEISSE